MTYECVKSSTDPWLCAVALEVVAHRVGVEQQGIGNVRHRATLTQENHRVDPIRLAHVPDPPVRRPQFGQLSFVQAVVCHGA